MREHEVPTHVQAEDRVLLWFTFPQIVALTAVAALAYGVYRYAPVGPEAVRVTLAGMFALAGAVLTAGQVGGRRLPAVAADLLRYALGARRFAGSAADLMRCEAPAPTAQTPGFFQHLAQKARRRLRRERRVGERQGHQPRHGHREHRDGRRMPGLGWLRSVRRRPVPETPGDDTRHHDRKGKYALQSKQDGRGRRDRRGKHDKPDKKTKRGRRFLLGAAALVLGAALLPQAALAQEPPPSQQWRATDIDFQPPPTVPGRRLYVEALEVSEGRAKVTVRAATDLSVRTQAFGGPGGHVPVTTLAGSLTAGQTAVYDLPLDGEEPSVTFAWTDGIGQAGAVSLKADQLPHPLPAAEGELCALRVTSLRWHPGFIDGTVAADCVTSLEETLTVDTVTGHRNEQAEVVRVAGVTAITGTVTVRGPHSMVRVPFLGGGETRFSLAIGAQAMDRPLSVAANLTATLTVPLPPVTVLTHHPARVERITETVHLHRPGDSDADSQTVTVTHDDGATSSATATAYAYVPSRVIAKQVTVEVQHKEHVRAEVVSQGDVQRTRQQMTDLRSALFGDARYAPLTLPAPEPVPAMGAQTAGAGADLEEHFRLLGWAWPW